MKKIVKVFVLLMLIAITCRTNGQEPDLSVMSEAELKSYYEYLQRLYDRVLHSYHKRQCYDFTSSSTPMAHHTGAGGSSYMNYYHGIMTTTIPITEGVSLSYNASGIRVEDISSWVGLGWNLNVGGVITRTVKGYPDDIACWVWDENSNSHFVTGWVHSENSEYSSTGAKICDFNPILENKHLLTKKINDLNGVLQFYGGNDYRSYKDDTEPDEFAFQCPGFNGNFYLDTCSLELSTAQSTVWNSVVNIFPFSNNRIEYSVEEILYESEVVKYPYLSFGENPIYHIKAFRITDEDGTIYLFEDLEWVYSTSDYTSNEPIPKTMPSHYLENGASFGRYVQSWFLTKIINVLGVEVNFVYENEELLLEESLYNVYRAFQNDGYDEYVYEVNGNKEIIVGSDTYTAKLKTKRLSQIYSDDFRIDFIAALERKDINAYSTNKPKALTKIKIYSRLNNTDELKKEVVFHYSYFDSYSDNEGYSVYAYNNESFPRYRLKLEDIQVYINNEITPPYTFEYYELDQKPDWLPRRYSYCQDLWGYFNANSTDETLIPSIYFDDNNDQTGSDRFSVIPTSNYDEIGGNGKGADRQANGDETIVQIGTIKKITTPDGATFEYVYESNEFEYDGETITGGGIRLVSVIKSPGIGNSITVNYDYNDSGLPIILPVYGYFDPTNYEECDYSSPGYSNWSLNDLNNYYVRSPFNMMEMPEGVIGYSQVTVTNQGGATGSIEYNFNNEATYMDYGSSALSYPDIFETSSTAFVPDSVDFWPNPTGDSIEIEQVPFFEEGLDFGIHSYPYAPNTNYSWCRGRLESIKKYEGSNVVEITENDYGIFIPTDQEVIQEVWGLKIASLRNNCIANNQPVGGCSEDYLNNPLHVFSKYKQLTGFKSVDKESTIKTFINATEYVNQNNKTFYNDYGQISEVHTTNSDGSILINKYTYPLDYWTPDDDHPTGTIDDASEAIITMAEKNMLNYPVESLTLRKNSLTSDAYVIGGTLAIYNVQTVNQNQVPMLTETWALITDDPIHYTNDFRSSQIDDQNNYSFDYDSDYKKFSSVEYDSKGNIIGYQEVNELPNASLWKWDDKRVIATAVNADNKELFVEDFEIYSESSWNESGAVDVETSTDVKSGNFILKLFPGAYITHSITFSSGEDFLNDQDGYKLYCWVKGNSNAKMNVIINGTSINKTSSSTDASNWNLLEIKITKSEIENISTPIQFTIKLYNNDGSNYAYFDDVKFYPNDASLIMFNFNSVGELLSTSDNNNIYLYYEYDDMGRSILSRDNKKQILSILDFKFGEPAEFIYFNNDDNDDHLRTNEVVKLIPNHKDNSLTYRVYWDLESNPNTYSDYSSGYNTIIHTYNTAGSYQIKLQLQLDGNTHSVDKYIEVID